MKILINNKKAYFNYEVIDKIEAGIVLFGWEVKSLKNGNSNITNAFIRERNGELFLMGSRIGLLASSFIQDKLLELRERKLLLQKNQIRKLIENLKTAGTTVVPLQVYTNDRGLIKLEIGLVKGKKKYEKRQKIKEREQKRIIEQDMKKYR
ncbi:MAG: SsrA-binding protein SmpB [Candidatus Dojkabacteria bacterium]